MPIINADLLDMAIELARPSALAILEAAGATWGPKWVTGLVNSSRLMKNFEFGISPEIEWKEEWGEKQEFIDIAFKKLILCQREKMSTSLMIATKPWLLEDGEFLYAGGVYDNGISASASGAKGFADEGIASIVASNVKMLAFLETERRIQRKEMQI